MNDLQLAGELALNTDPSAALGLLQRAEAIEGTPRNELLIARAYQRLNQPDQSKIYLQRAESRAPSDPEVLRAVASYYRDSNQFDVAIATLQKIPKKTPDILGELAYTYQLAGKRKRQRKITLGGGWHARKRQPATQRGAGAGEHWPTGSRG